MTAAKLTIGSPSRFLGYDAEQAAQFAAASLPAWSGNDPRHLASFYKRDTFEVFFDRSLLLDAIREQRITAHTVPHGNDNPLPGMERADGDGG